MQEIDWDLISTTSILFRSADEIEVACVNDWSNGTYWLQSCGRLDDLLSTRRCRTSLLRRCLFFHSSKDGNRKKSHKCNAFYQPFFPIQSISINVDGGSNWERYQGLKTRLHLSLIWTQFSYFDSLFSADLASRHIHAWYVENHKIRPNRKGGIGGYSNENAHVWLTRDAHNGSKRQHD